MERVAFISSSSLTQRQFLNEEVRRDRNVPEKENIEDPRQLHCAFPNSELFTHEGS
jgi:hypothetical protein